MFVYICLFQHKDSVTMVKFAHNDPGLLACCSLDGSLSICQVADGEPRVLHTLQLHTAGVTGKPPPLPPSSTTLTPVTPLPAALTHIFYDDVYYNLYAMVR